MVATGSIARPTRILELDLLRIVAAAAVVVFHYQRYHPAGLPTWLGFTRYGYLGVELFFFISGAVIFRSARDRTAGAFLRARGMRLFPAYWACVAVTGAVLLVAGPSWFHVSVLDWAVNFSMLQGFLGVPPVDGVYWTLTEELIFYGVVAAALWRADVRRLLPALALWMLVSVTIGEAALTYGWKGFAPLVWQTPWAPFFVAGACLAAAVDGDRTLMTWALGASALAFSLVVTAQVTRITMLPDTGARPAAAVLIVAGSFLSLVLVLTGVVRATARPWMASAGAISYPLYLLHPNLGYLAFGRFGWVNYWLLLALITAALVAAAAATNRWIERPASAWSRRGRVQDAAQAADRGTLPPRAVE